MRKSYALILVAGALLGDAVIAQHAPPASPQSHEAVTTSAASYRAVATVQDLMAELIDPASKVVFGAVSSQVTSTGTVETAPRNDAEWAVVRRNALIMVEGANLLLIPGRRMASPSLASVAACARASTVSRAAASGRLTGSPGASARAANRSAIRGSAA